MKVAREALLGLIVGHWRQVLHVGLLVKVLRVQKACRLGRTLLVRTIVCLINGGLSTFFLYLSQLVLQMRVGIHHLQNLNYFLLRLQRALHDALDLTKKVVLTLKSLTLVEDQLIFPRIF